MRLTVAWVGKSKDAAISTLTAEYLKRLRRYLTVEGRELGDQAALLKLVCRPGRTAPILVLLDSRGKQLSSEEFAEFVRGYRDRGSQEMIFVVGPADGWNEETRTQANALLSLGKMTYAHELARVVLAEQLYRAFTILAGHPYHCGH
ncbi:MAG TPA: 23S rRNA (pseudouridine(1915)-N(3))-methyltransferase RlmH [Terriglobales bacterium]|nr:23S rRNA (pseudouridine(1915)-N(3))-methyltransferase RlmH [Terriglobales bacterium]